MTQIIDTDLRTALIEGSETGNAVNYAHDFTDLLGNVLNTRGFFQTLGSNLAPDSESDNLTLTAGTAFIKYHKTSGEIGFLKFSLTANRSFDLSTESNGDYYCFIELDDDKVNNGSDEIDGSDVAVLKVASALPETSDYLEICHLSKNGTALAITDTRELIKLSVGELSLDEKKIPHSKIHEFGLEYSAGSLSVTVRGGVYKEDGTANSDTTLTLAANATNYIDLNTVSGTVASNTSGFSGIALYVITTNADGVTNVIDKRQALIGSQGGGEVAGTAEALAGTNDTKFMSPLKTAQAFSAQHYPFAGQTTNITQTEIFLGGVSGSRLTIPASSILNFEMLITARSSTNEMMTAKVRGAIKRDGSNNTALLYAPEIFYNNTPVGSLTSAVYSGKSVALNSQDANPRVIFFKPDGLTMFMCGSGSKTVYQYTLSTAWDVSTSSYASKYFNISAQETTPFGLFFSADGTKMYILGSGTKIVYQYTLSTAWDVSTASYASKYFSVNVQDTSPANLAFSSTGTKMFVLGTTNKTVYQYTLSTAWDVSTASYASQFINLSSPESLPRGLHISNDGKNMYITGYTNKILYQYTLNATWDVNSAILTSSFYIGSEENDPISICTGPGKTKLYLIGNASKSVFEYYTPTAWTVAVEADDTNEALVLKVSGETGKTINWQAKLFCDLNKA